MLFKTMADVDQIMRENLRNLILKVLRTYSQLELHVAWNSFTPRTRIAHVRDSYRTAILCAYTTCV